MDLSRSRVRTVDDAQQMAEVFARQFGTVYLRFHRRDAKGPGLTAAFDQRFERMVAWQSRRQPDALRSELEAATLKYMASMPAWRDDPRVASYR
jgi:hypothetical protein